jgi:gamma-glutamyltranspeptidase/glutathione hydrolase
MAEPGAARTILRVAAFLALTFGVMPVARAGDPPTAAQHHMAATANPLATRAALSVLRDGGSAIDAAIAGQMVLAVVEPQSSGLGGGSLLMVWDAKASELSYFEGLASAPAAMPQDYAHGPDGKPLDAKQLERSGRVVAVPGTLATLAMVHARYGRLPWPRLFRDAIALADDGFAMPHYLHETLQQRSELARKPDFAGYFDAAGAPLPVGATLTNHPLATTLRKVAEQGAKALYQGPIAEDIVRAADQGAMPGTLTAADLANYQPHRRAPVCLVAFDHRICSAAPPVSGGIALLQQLGIAERLHIAAQPQGSAEAAHLFIEAARLAEADRRSFVGDPDQVDVPVAGLLDSTYLDQRAATIDPAHALVRAVPGSPPLKHAALPLSDPLALPATTHLAIIDDDGNAVSFTTTINLNFGADIVVDGIVLNDALTNFATNPVADGKTVANAAAPGKRPITTMAPTIVFDRNGKVALIVGAGGGARIIDSVAETILGVLAWGDNVRDAIEQPRIGGENRAQELERATPAAGLADELRTMGHEIKITAMNAGVQAIAVTPRGFEGWGDPHRDGVALGD